MQEKEFPEKESGPRKKWIKATSIFLLALTLIFFVIMVKSYFDGHFKSVDTLQEYISGYGAFGPVILTVFQAAQVVLPVLPGFLGCAAGAIMFGPLVGFLCNYIGISFGSVVAFLLAKHYGAGLVDDLFKGKRYKKIAQKAAHSKRYALGLFLAMLLPLFPDDYLCYLSGLTKMSTKKFICIIILGKPWCILAYSLGFSLINF